MRKKLLLKIITALLSVCLLSACGLSNLTDLTLFIPAAADHRIDVPVSSQAEPVVPGNPATDPQTPGEQSADTPTPFSFWISPEVPGGAWSITALPAGFVWAEGLIGDTVILGSQDRMPPGQVILGQGQVIYALVAPFFTVQDSVTAQDLQSLWQGRPQSSTEAIKRLLVFESDYNALLSILGDAPGGDVISPTITVLGEDGAGLYNQLSPSQWAIIPFDQLNPQMKVITIDGISPLRQDFDEQAYLLESTYSLYASPEVAQAIPEQALTDLSFGLVPTNRDSQRLTSLVMTGVTALVRATAYKMEMNGMTYPARDIGDWLRGADLTHISNEVSFYENCPYPDPISPSLMFCSSPAYISLLDDIDADIIELTGNHINDADYLYDVEAARMSLDIYTQHGMIYYGGGASLTEAKLPALIEHNGNKIAFIGCNAPGPDFAFATADSAGAAPCEDLVWLENEVARLSTEGYLPVVTFQYYEDYLDYAQTQMKRDFRKIAEAGAVIVNGSQAHRPKEMEFFNEAFIHYGLGNLFFDQMGITYNGIYYLQTRWEFIQRHVFYNGRHISVELLTAMLEDYARPRPMTEEERAFFLGSIFSIQNPLGTGE